MIGTRRGNSVRIIVALFVAAIKWLRAEREEDRESQGGGVVGSFEMNISRYTHHADSKSHLFEKEKKKVRVARAVSAT